MVLPEEIKIISDKLFFLQTGFLEAVKNQNLCIEKKRGIYGDFFEKI